MKSYCFLLLLFVLLIKPAYGRQTDPAKVQNAALRAELLDWKEKDQGIRFAMRAEGRSDSLLAQMRAIDSLSTIRIKEIVGLHGWPDYELVGRDGSKAAFLMVQHSSDSDFQEMVLPMMKQSFEEQKTDGESVALLTDRILVRRGDLRLYGTQAQTLNGTVRFFPIADSTNLEERRERMGMIPFKLYVQIMNGTVSNSPKKEE